MRLNRYKIVDKCNKNNWMREPYRWKKIFQIWRKSNRKN